VLTGHLPDEQERGNSDAGKTSTCMSPIEGKEIFMYSILLVVWAVLIVCFLALLVYRGQLARYEEEQLFLGDEVSQEQVQQEAIVRRLQKIDPIVKIVGGAAGLATAFAVGLYVWDAWQKLQS
jgi:hypothetical protein